MALEKELETYRSALGEWREEEGKWALIHESEVLGLFDTYREALKQGYTRVGFVPFLVKQVHQVEQVPFLRI